MLLPPPLRARCLSLRRPNDGWAGGPHSRYAGRVHATGHAAVPARDGRRPAGALDAAFERLTDALRNASVSVQFEIDSTSHRVITKVMDKSSGEVIRQIPTEELVRISDAMTELQGLFVNQTA